MSCVSRNGDGGVQDPTQTRKSTPFSEARVLPVQKMELAIFKCVERSGPVLSTNIPTLATVIGTDTSHHLIIERLKDLHDGRRILLSKISGNERVPFR
jgi:hypothetical protein